MKRILANLVIGSPMGKRGHTWMMRGPWRGVVVGREAEKEIIFIMDRQ